MIFVLFQVAVSRLSQNLSTLLLKTLIFYLSKLSCNTLSNETPLAIVRIIKESEKDIKKVQDLAAASHSRGNSWT
ncbi:hypothetical protein BpHYR1_010896 [Brachionus plicatilis]|uniref:Uncharacterized protein n=1 Tax=Brachionus plicatilis TaxID=10195 RepID=A0A3M7QW03_BRAPC|nr:hypothetical protein BpHYR1_010896 [Brachionus plicatilis]